MSEPGAVPPAAGGRRALTRRILAFAGVPLLSLLAPFLFLPVLARLAGTEAWVAIALGQSVGGFAALVAGLGYTTLAPPRVALADAAARRRIIATSVHARLPAWVLAATIGVIVTVLLAPPSHRLEAAGMTAAMSLAALAPTWYWIGVGRAAPILWTEVVPRTVATLLATGVLLAGGGVIWYPVLLFVAMVAGPLGVYLRVGGRELARISRPEVVEVLRTHPPAVVAETAAGAYNSLAVVLVTAAAPLAQAARYVSGDKTYRIGQYAVSAFGNALQGWVAEGLPHRPLLARRLRITVMLHAALGLCGLLAFAVLGSWLTALLFGQKVAIDELTALGFGVATLGIALGTACGRIGLVTLGARHAFMVCVLAASAVGVVALLVGAAVAGAPGAAWALGLTELASGTAQGLVLLAVWRRRAVASSS